MKKYIISKAMRFFLFVSATLIWIGIWLTGFANAHWLLYIPAVFFTFAVITGICPGMIVSQLLFKEKQSTSDKS